MAGFSQGGGVGLSLANWMTEGDPGFDIWGMDVARFGDWATLAYTNAKVRENYSRRFRIRFPNEELPAARPAQTTPLYDRMLTQGAVMGDSWGLETPLWFAPEGVEPIDIVSFHRSNDFPHIKAECEAVRDAVGISEIANFAKYRVTGEGAEAWLSQLMTNRMPRTGRMILTPMLNDFGKLIGDFTIAKMAHGDFRMFGSIAAQIYHMRWFEQHLPEDGSVRIENVGLNLTGITIAGPNARKLLQRVTHLDVSNEAFRFMAFREMDVAGVPTMTGRISYTGELGYEIWVEPAFERALYDGLMATGDDLGLRNFGMRALLCMRLEKNFPTWFRELRPIYGPFEAGMDRFIDLKKNDFIGRTAAAKELDDGPERKRVTFQVEATDADVIGDEAIFHGPDVVGWVTSGGYGHRVGLSLAQGYVPSNLAVPERQETFEIEILGDRRKAHILHEPPYDPAGERMRS